MINLEQKASNQKNKLKFDIIKSMDRIEQAQKPGSSEHYESLLQKRWSGRQVNRRRGE